MKPSKKTRRAEGRDRPERIPQGEARIRTQSRVILMPNLERVNAAAKQAVQTRFTSLLHHVDQAALHRAFRRQKRQASAGVDGMTWRSTKKDWSKISMISAIESTRSLPATAGAACLHSQSRWRKTATWSARSGG